MNRPGFSVVTTPTTCPDVVASVPASARARASGGVSGGVVDAPSLEQPVTTAKASTLAVIHRTNKARQR